MATLTPERVSSPPARTSTGIGLGVLASALFAMSGVLARGPLLSGWSPGAVVTVRVGIAALVLLPFVLHGVVKHRTALRANWRVVLGYGFFAIALAQLGFFSAVAYLPVGVALLIEYFAPVMVLGYLWFLGEKPSRLTVLGALLSIGGLAMVLGIFSGLRLHVLGVGWGLLAALGLAVYFILSARPSDLPATVLVGCALLFGTLVLGAAGALGILAWQSSTELVTYATARGDVTVQWWLPLVCLGLFTAAFAYLVGIAASQRLGSRVAAFVSLTEVLFAVAFAWLFLGEAVRPDQLVGGALLLAGVVAVKLGEK